MYSPAYQHKEMTVLFAIVVILLLLFAYIDVWYFTRFFLSLFLGKRKRSSRGHSTREEFMRELSTYSIVLPSDIDAFLHMNNTKYMKEFDIARVGMAAEMGFLDIVKKHGGYFAMNAGSIRYRRSMKLFQRFTVKSKVVAWDRDSFYIEQRTVTPDGFVTSILLSKYVMKGVSIEQCLVGLCGEIYSSPELTSELATWIESIKYSSETLRSEAGLQSRTSIIREIGALSLTR